MTTATHRPSTPTVALRRRRSRPNRGAGAMLRALLYGKADRHAKARGRIGLAIIAFTAVYGIIAGRLVRLRDDARQPRRRGAAARRRGRDRAPRHPRSQRRGAGDRREGGLAVRRAEAADRRRRSGRAAHRRDAGPRRHGSARAPRQPQARLCLAQARDQRRSSSRRSTGSAFRASASSTRTSAPIRTARRSRT